jgi:hypothetical protein
MKKAGQKVPKKTKLATSHADNLACMDYLHGDVKDGDFEAACGYEYARESNVMREAAKLSVSGISDTEIACKVEDQFQCGHWFIQQPWGFIWQCPSFPAKSWNQLGEQERADIRLVFPLPADKVQPLRMNEVWNLQALGIFDEFKAMAAKQMEDKRTCGPKSPKPVYPVIDGWPKYKRESSPWVHALFHLDFSKQKKRLLQEFAAWLELPENQKRRKLHERKTVGKTGTFKDRLKDLASWRLYRELGCDKALQFATDNRLRDKANRPRGFHDQRKDPTKKLLLHEMPLYSEESAFEKAKAKAKDFLGELIPWEFGEFAKERERQNAERAARVAKMWAEINPQISKSFS